VATTFAICPSCGTHVHPIASRCKYCRTDLRAARSAPTTIQTLSQVTLPPARPRRTRTIVGLGLVAATALAFAVHARLAASADAEPAIQPVADVATAKPAPPPKPDDRYAALAGRWRGSGHQPDVHMDWDVTLTIDGTGPVGTKIGTVDYPTLGCSGEIVRRPDEGDLFVIHERILVDPERHCVPEGTLKFSLTGGSLESTWWYANGREAARGTLSR
jgi:hypothetical protein